LAPSQLSTSSSLRFSDVSFGPLLAGFFLDPLETLNACREAQDCLQDIIFII